MRTRVVMLVLASSVVPSVAGADCWSPQCVMSQRLGLGRLDPHIAEIVGASAAAMIAMAATMAELRRQGEEKPLPDGVVEVADDSGKMHKALQLIPTPMGMPETPDGYETLARPDGAFRFNEHAANVAIAIGGAAILTSVVMGLLSNGKH